MKPLARLYLNYLSVSICVGPEVKPRKVSKRLHSGKREYHQYEFCLTPPHCETLTNSTFSSQIFSIRRMSSIQTMTAGDLTPFGKPMLKHWLFDPAYKNLNHGRFPLFLFPNPYRRLIHDQAPLVRIRLLCATHSAPFWTWPTDGRIHIFERSTQSFSAWPGKKWPE